MFQSNKKTILLVLLLFRVFITCGQTFNTKDFYVAAQSFGYPDHLVLENENEKTKGLELLFLFAKVPSDERKAKEANVEERPAVIRKIGEARFNRYVVAIPAQYVKIGKDAGGTEMYVPKYPCKATVYHFNKKWELVVENKSFESKEKIGSYMKSLNQQL